MFRRFFFESFPAYLEKISSQTDKAIIPIDAALSSVSFYGKGFDFEIGNNEIVVRSGNVRIEEQAKLVPTAEPIIGDTLKYGADKGWIYCETATREPFLVEPKDSGVMRWRDAMTFALRRGAELPSRDQLKALYESQHEGKLKGSFNQSGAYPNGRYWVQEEIALIDAWGRRFSDGLEYHIAKESKSSVRCVRPYAVV